MDSTRKKVGEKYCDWLPHLTYCYIYYDGVQCFKLLIYFGNSIQYILFNCWNRNFPFMDGTGDGIDFSKKNCFEEMTGTSLDIKNFDIDRYNQLSNLHTKYFILDFKPNGHLGTIEGQKHVRIKDYTCILELARQSELEKRKKMLAFMKYLLPKEKPLPKDFYETLRKLFLFSQGEECNHIYVNEYESCMLPIVKKLCVYLENVETVNMKVLKEKSNKILELLKDCKEIELLNSLIKDVFSYEVYETDTSKTKQHIIFSMPFDLCSYIMQSMISKDYNVLISEFLFEDTSYCEDKNRLEYFYRDEDFYESEEEGLFEGEGLFEDEEDYSNEYLR